MFWLSFDLTDKKANTSSSPEYAGKPVLLQVMIYVAVTMDTEETTPQTHDDDLCQRPIMNEMSVSRVVTFSLLQQHSNIHCSFLYKTTQSKESEALMLHHNNLQQVIYTHGAWCSGQLSLPSLLGR